MQRGTDGRHWLLTMLAPALIVTACATQPPDDGLHVYFREADLGALGEQALAVYSASDPGASRRLERAFPGAPPQIPHSVEDMLPITADDNECLECHLPDNATDPDDVPLPDTHFERPVMAAGDASMVWVVSGYVRQEELAGSRYNCTMCHTPQATNVRTPRTLFRAD